MRLLHTSDWHLGQTFRDFDRSHEHRRFLGWLLERIESEQADAVLVTGDIFDNANPAAASQKLLYRFLRAAKARNPGLAVVLVAGNHDSPARLEAPAALLERIDAHVIGQIPRDAAGRIKLRRLVLPLRSRSGDIRAWCLAIPFLRPGDVPRVEAAGDPYLEGIAKLYQDALALALDCRKPGQAIIALGHCHMAGGIASQDSERNLVVGGAEMLSPSLFDEAIAYAALGHLHRPQRVGGKDWIRYCGSPLPMSFAEIHYKHQILRIDLDGENLASVTPIPVPRFVELLRVPERPAPLADVLAALERIEAPQVPEEEWPYLEVKVLLDGPTPGLRAKIEEALADKPVRLAKIEPGYQRTEQTGLDTAPLDDLDKLGAEDIFQSLYRQKYSGEVPEAVLQAFGELLREAAEEGGA